MKLYEYLPVYENDGFLLRPVEKEDCSDLLEVYSDKNALPFFNSDNCDGDIFYYADENRMADAMKFWQTAYENQWFARWAIVDKTAQESYGSTSEAAMNGKSLCTGSGL